MRETCQILKISMKNKEAIEKRFTLLFVLDKEPIPLPILLIYKSLTCVVEFPKWWPDSTYSSPHWWLGYTGESRVASGRDQIPPASVKHRQTSSRWSVPEPHYRTPLNERVARLANCSFIRKPARDITSARLPRSTWTKSVPIEISSFSCHPWF